MKHSVEELQMIANEIRMDVMEMAPRSGNHIHIGPAFSCTEILTALYYEAMTIDENDPDWDDRDRFIISKGHATPALYSILARLGYVDREELWNIKNIDCRLQGHPDMNKIPGIDMTAGSLGNGLSIGLGMAMGLKYRKKKSHVFVLVGDGEFQEGLVLEAMMAAPNKNADNLTAILDYNHHQSSGSVDKIMNINPIADKWKSFGWNVIEVDGHNLEELASRLKVAKNFSGAPTVIIAHTIKGKGVSFIEHNNAWHARIPTNDEYTQAMAELKAQNDVLQKKLGK